MKLHLIKISTIFFLTILLASNVINLHIYFHDDIQELSHCNNDENEEEAPCDICHIAFNLNNLDYNNSLQFSFKSLNQTQPLTQNKVSGYVEILQKQLYLNKNRNKAPPHLA